ncbi:helix-turn-helix domain-containing protein [Desulfoscipio gibsoniae]
MDIGKRIKSIREDLGLSGRALALKVGLDPSQINKIEHNINKPSLEALERICDALGVTIAEFFTEPHEQETLPPEARRIIDKVKKLSPEKLKILEPVLDSWIDND